MSCSGHGGYLALDCARNDPFRGSSTRCLIASFSAFGQSATALYAMRGSDFAHTVNWAAPALPAARLRFARRVAGVAGARRLAQHARREAMICKKRIRRSGIAVGRKRFVCCSFVRLCPFCFSTLLAGGFGVRLFNPFLFLFSTHTTDCLLVGSTPTRVED